MFVFFVLFFFFFWGGESGRGWGSGSRGAVRVEVNEEVKFFENKNKTFFFWRGGGVGSGMGVRVDLNGEVFVKN